MNVRELRIWAREETIQAEDKVVESGDRYYVGRVDAMKEVVKSQLPTVDEILLWVRSQASDARKRFVDTGNRRHLGRTNAMDDVAEVLAGGL